MKMTRLQLLSSFLTERLTELVKEVLDVVEDTVTEYREEAARTKRENDSLRRQLRDILLLESDTEWLLQGRGSTRPGLGSAAAEQQSSEAELRSGSEETDSILNQNQNQNLQLQLPADSAEPVVSVQLLSIHSGSPPSTVFLPRNQKSTEAWEWAQKSEPQPEVITKSSPHSSLNSPSASGARNHSEVVLHREEPGLPAVIKAEPEEKNVTEPEGHTDSVTLTPHTLVPSFRDRDAERPAVVMHAERHEGHRSSKSSQERAPLTADDRTVAGFASELVHRCPRCGEAFGQASGLRLHLEQKRKTYACDWCCKSFAQSADLRRHLRTHTGERPHCCSFCSKSFSQRGNLRRHLRIHTGERPYSCPYCCRSFSDGDTMKKHKRTHSGEKPYRCVQCSKTFTTAGSLQIHVRKDKCFVAKA